MQMYNYSNLKISFIVNQSQYNSSHIEHNHDDERDLETCFFQNT